MPVSNGNRPAGSLLTLTVMILPLVIVAVGIGSITPRICAQDCNDNGRVDSDDISAAFSTDCNADGVPDECESLPLHYTLDDEHYALARTPRRTATGDLMEMGMSISSWVFGRSIRSSTSS